MTETELEALLEELEAGLQVRVAEALSETARDFSEAVDGATELVAARFSVSGIGAMWRRRTGPLMDRLRTILRRGADTTAESVGDPLPDGWDKRTASYVDTTQALLAAVGDRLAADATEALAEGLNRGESVDELKSRLLSVFANDGTKLGESRAERIARTEATRAWNAGTLAAAQALTGPDRPLVKQWLTRRDDRVRVQHADTNGQIQFLDDPFDVAGTPMRYPGDPEAPADLTVNCRCVLVVTAAARTEEDSVSAAGVDSEDFQSRMPAQLKAYWLTGEGAAKIRWGTPGSFDRCVRALRPDFPQDPEGLCANLHHEATGRWPNEGKADGDVTAAADGSHTSGAMIALIPTEADAQRLAIGGGEAVEELHLTLFFLGAGADWAGDARADLVSRVATVSRMLTPVSARAFGAAQWNPASDEPAWVWNVGDDRDANGSTLHDAHREARWVLEDRIFGPDIPAQYEPWAPHICAQYTKDNLSDVLASRVGPITFDRIRVVFAGDTHDFELTGSPADPDTAPADPEPVELAEETSVPAPPPVIAPWHTPDGTGLAFENQQTGDGRLFVAGSLYWTGGPWPLQYADEMNGGHDGARLAGAINRMDRDGDRLDADGPLYLTQEAGAEAAMLLAQGAPLGVSVDLDDVDLQMTRADGNGTAEPYRAHFITASVLPLPDGGWTLTGETATEWTASGSSLVGESAKMTMHINADGKVPAEAFSITAAAGDVDPGGTVLEEQKSGQFLVRITRARVRGATLVSMPALADARIVLADASLYASAELTAAKSKRYAGSKTYDYDRVIRHVNRSLVPVSATDVAKSLSIPVADARRYLQRATKKGTVVRLVRGMYTKPNVEDATAAATAVAEPDDLGNELSAAATGAVNLPVAPRDTNWNGDAAGRRVFDAGRATDGFAYRNDDANPETLAAWSLPYADLIDGKLTIVPKGASAALGAVNGARGGTSIPAGEVAAVRAKLEAILAHVDEVTGEDGRDEMEASAWTAMASMPAMPSSWFAEPTAEELPPGGPGVNYRNGRIFGWVAQSGEPHAGFAKKITIEGLGRIDTSHFLRQRFTLDDGSTVKAGAFTMNVGHHRDGAECETAACQFDDTRTVAGIVTVGMNARGMWFSGAAAPWMSEWDRQVFAVTQPSYHMRKGPNGNWQLRAVLSVPVPGHSSPLLASAVAERSQLALTAAATMAEVEDVVASVEEPETAAETEPVVVKEIGLLDYAQLADALVAAIERADERKAREAAELEALRIEAGTL